MVNYPKSNRARKGRYVHGGIVEDFGSRLGWWERTTFPKSGTDVLLTLEVQYKGRPDLLAYDLYGDETLGWFIMQYNAISDINKFVTGIILILPIKSRVFNELLVKRT
jgi:hypothetical protein